MTDELFYPLAIVWYFIFYRKYVRSPFPPIPLSKGHHLHVSMLQEPFCLFKVKKSPGLKQLARNLPRCRQASSSYAKRKENSAEFKIWLLLRHWKVNWDLPIALKSKCENFFF